MKKIAFMFPGVGSQCVGMGKYFYDNFQIARQTFEEASDTLTVDFTRLCFSPSEAKELEKLENSQLALLSVSTASARVFEQEIGIEPRYCLGHSLGEYSALCCAGSLALSDALVIVKERGRILSRAASTMGGIMAWVINLETKVVEKVIAESSGEGDEIFISAYDSPTQSSISGPRDTVVRVGRKLEKEGAIVYPLKLSGPFHCPLMAEAAEKIKPVLQQVTYRTPRYPVIANRNAAVYPEEGVVDNLSMQLVHPVRWQASIQFLLDRGIDTAVEVGPDKVLKHLMKNNTADIETFSFENAGDFSLLKKTFSA